MNFDHLDEELREQMKGIALMSEQELAELGLNAVLRDSLLEGIVATAKPDECWHWSGGRTSCSGKLRPAVFFKSKMFLAYRVLMAILMRKRIDELEFVLHKCPG